MALKDMVRASALFPEALFLSPLRKAYFDPRIRCITHKKRKYLRPP